MSGFVDKNISTHNRVKKGITQIIIPYIFWYLLSYVYWLVVSFSRRPEMYERNIVDGVFKPMAGLLLGVGYDTSFSIMVNVPLWFLPCIFWVKVIYSLIENLDVKKKFFIVIVIMFFAILIGINDILLPFSLGPAFMCFPIYYVGVLLRKQELRFKISSNIALLVFSSFLLVFIVKINGFVDVNNMLYGKSPVLFYVGSMAGILIVCLVSKFLETIGLHSSVLGGNTLTILGLQTIVASLIKKIYAVIILHKLDRLDDYRWELGHAMTVSVLNFCVCGFVCLLIIKLNTYNKNKVSIRGEKI